MEKMETGTLYWYFRVRHFWGYADTVYIESNDIKIVTEIHFFNDYSNYSEVIVWRLMRMCIYVGVCVCISVGVGVCEYLRFCIGVWVCMCVEGYVCVWTIQTPLNFSCFQTIRFTMPLNMTCSKALSGISQILSIIKTGMRGKPSKLMT